MPILGRGQKRKQVYTIYSVDTEHDMLLKFVRLLSNRSVHFMSWIEANETYNSINSISGNSYGRMDANAD